MMSKKHLAWLAVVALTGCGSESSAPAAATRGESVAHGPSAAGDAVSDAAVDLTCDQAVFPSVLWSQCEATNFARSLEAPTEQLGNPAFMAQLARQSAANTNAYLQRAILDPSWLLASNPTLDALLAATLTNPAQLAQVLQGASGSLASANAPGLALPLNAPLTPLCTLYALQCAGDPFRYPEASGKDGADFYATEADVRSVVFYDRGCARVTGQVWAPRTVTQRLPAVVIENGSIQASQPLYWFMAQRLVRSGYVVMTFDPRGQGRSDMQTPTGEQGGNAMPSVFTDGLVDAIDFFRSTPEQRYPWNDQCRGSYPTAVNAYNPLNGRVDPDRLGIAGHSAGAFGVSVVQGFDAAGAKPWPGQLDTRNPVDVAVAWDTLVAGDAPLSLVSQGAAAVPRVPAMNFSSEYYSPGAGTLAALTAAPFTSPPDPEAHKAAYKAFVQAGVPAYSLTIAGSTHFDFSQLATFPATSWCPRVEQGRCTGGWASGVIESYTVAWFDRWLKQPGDVGFADADARLTNDKGAQGRTKLSWHFRSARDFPRRDGSQARCADIRAGC